MVQSPVNWPDWWYWELNCSNPHLLKRMTDRSFTEVDLREMLESATSFSPDRAPERWLIETTHAGQPGALSSSLMKRDRF